MKKQLIIVGIIIIILTVGLSGCNEDNNTVQSDEKKIIGIWTYKEPYEGKMITGSFTFLSNKTCKYSASYGGVNETKLSGTWNITNNKLVLNLEGTQTETNDYKFSNHDKTLTITDKTGYTRYLTKQ